MRPMDRTEHTTPQSVMVSVVMAVRNGEKYITQAIDSILAQDYDDFELIVVDDGSSDATIRLLSQIEDCRLRVVQRKHDYVASLNAGIGAARGQYIALTDHDDLMMPHRLQTQVQLMDAFPNITVCGGNMALFRNDDITKARIPQAPPSGMIDHPLYQMMRGNFINNPTAMIRTSFLRGRGIGYDPLYPFAPDFKMWLDIACAGGVFFNIASPLTYYRLGETQMTSTCHQEQRRNANDIRLLALRRLILKMPPRERSEHIYRLYSCLDSMRREGDIIDEDLLHIFYIILGKRMRQE